MSHDSQFAVKHDTSEFNGIMVYSKLDDFGLTPHEFRIVGHLARRAGGQNGKAWPSVKSIAEICRIHRDTVFSSLKSLEESHIIERQQRDGNSTIYVLNPPSKWSKPRPPKSPRNRGVGNKGASEIKGHPPVGNKGTGGVGNKGTQRVSTEGNPLEGNPIPPNPQGGSSEFEFIPAILQTPEFHKAWNEWQAERKQRRKKLTPAAISRQLAKLEAMGPENAVASINQSIEQGWTGLFDPKTTNGTHQRSNQQVNRNAGTLNEGRNGSYDHLTERF